MMLDPPVRVDRLVTALNVLTVTRPPAVPDQDKTSVSVTPLTVPVTVTLPVGLPLAWTRSRLRWTGRLGDRLAEMVTLSST